MATGRQLIAAVALKFLTGVAVTGAAALPQIGHGQSPTLEAQVKATYVYNFVQFVEWPPAARDDGEAFHLCVLGNGRLGAALDGFGGERVDGRVIRVVRLTTVDDAARSHCRLVFLSRSAGDSAELLARVPSQGVLTVGEAPNFTGAGGMIGLYEVRGRVHFSINNRAARRAGLIVSSRLLQLARER
ncbi:MAG: YfiR family protein [Gammaproteobacteria bacterium]